MRSFIKVNRECEEGALKWDVGGYLQPQSDFEGPYLLLTLEEKVLLSNTEIDHSRGKGLNLFQRKSTPETYQD